jgi:hypothetical protein
VGGFCRYPTRLGISVRNAEVRACDVLLQHGARAVTRIHYPASVVGEHVRRGNRTAVSFMRRSNSGSAGTAVTLELAGTQPVAPTDLTLVEAHCHGPDGAPIAEPDLTIE